MHTALSNGHFFFFQIDSRTRTYAEEKSNSDNVATLSKDPEREVVDGEEVEQTEGVTKIEALCRCLILQSFRRTNPFPPQSACSLGGGSGFFIYESFLW
jgi:hypothetical protein